MSKSALICVRNGLLSDGIIRMFYEKNSLIKISEERNAAYFEAMTKTQKPDIVVIEVRGIRPYTLAEWGERLREMRETLPRCKIAMIVDDENYPDTAEAVKKEKANGKIDAFFYASSGLAYLVDAIESL